MKHLLLFWGLIVLVRLCCAQPGKLDENFGRNGKVATSFIKAPIFKEYGQQVLQQADGKILVVFFSSGLTLARYLPDGTLDFSYGYEGYTQGLGSTEFSFKRAVILSDGSVLLAGNLNNDFAFIHYGENGEFDKKFGKEGFLTVDIGSFDALTSIAINNKRIIAIGSTINGGIKSFAALRLKEDGKFDKRFGKNGKLVLNLGSPQFSYSTMAVQKDDKIIIGGSFLENNILQGLAFRLFENGSIDSSFGNNGVSILNTGELRSITFQQDGKIVAIDNRQLIRLTKSGIPDKEFGMEGLHPLNWTVNPVAVAVQNDSKIVVSGTIVFGTIVTRYNTDGSFDYSYGSSIGRAIIDPTRSTYPSSMILQSDGKVVLTGYNSPYSSGTQFYLFRLTNAGYIDPTFENKGLGLIGAHFFSNYSTFDAITVQKDGKMVVGGKSGSDGSYSYLIAARYLSNGSLDTSFGEGGKFMIYTGSYYTRVGVVQRPSSGYVLALNKELYGLDKNGKLDSLFGVEGKVVVPMTITAMTLLKNGKVLLLGSGEDESNSPVLSVYNDNGTPDLSFGVNGMVSLKSISSGGSRVFISNSQVLAVQNDGKILIASEFWNGTGLDRYLVRLKQDGTLDNTFDGDGQAQLNFGSDFAVSSLAIQNDGKILAAGSALLNNKRSFAVARMDINGAVDETFGTLGIQYIDFGVSSSASSVDVQQDGQIYLAGTTSSFNGSDIAVAAITKDGKPDKTFGDNGKTMTDILNSYDIANVGVLAGKRLLAIGQTSSQSKLISLIAAYKLSGPSVEISKARLDDVAIEVNLTNNLQVHAISNPSTAYFTLRISSGSNETVTMRVIDFSGRVIIQKQKIGANSTQRIGQDFITGAYLAEFVQGADRVVVKLVKQ